MSLTQQLLLRALMAEFWERPYKAKLQPWGTELHGRFMLPHFVWQDFTDVIGDMREAGHAFQPEWFAPHQEFRFPICGATQFREIHLELRNALEPWHVLGEEGILGGTVRYVDSSVERLQVKASGLVGTRYQVLCNGIPVPMHPPERSANSWRACGIAHGSRQIVCTRRSACTHRWSSTCTTTGTEKPWPAARITCRIPAAESHDFPVNSYEAESRRLARFFPGGHSPGTFTPPAPVKSEEFPFTLDLRRFSGV